MVAPTAQTLAALIAFAVACSWTPGPNNVMLASSGATFGFARTRPHILGVTIGVTVMVFTVTLGLGEVFRSAPALQTVIAWLGFAVMLWLAFRIARQSAAGRKNAARPLSFVGAALFQWVNPKAWVMCIAAAATYASGGTPLHEALIIAIVFLFVSITSTTAWAASGAALSRLLGSGWRLRAFNVTMALLLALSALWLVVDG
ncbi:LysE family translocator [Acuticoccus kandeliae]|uniref:LysE family translocator n=1 Tax=Acuticoccus kandeliae TaxID=2073160 RepID=UPI000D3E6B6F|nr:LysE family translocator [Acuticoccus kandeliae]